MPEIIDYQQLIAELGLNHVSIHKIAILMTQAGLPTQFIQVKRWSEGREPKDRQARLLIAIHDEHVPRETLQK